MRKFAARYRWQFALAGVVLCFAVFGVASVVYYAQQAEARLVDMVQVTEAIISELSLRPGRQQTERRLLEESARRLERLWQVTQSPEVAGSLYRALFEMGLSAGYPTGRGIGDTVGAEHFLGRALTVAEWLLQRDPQDRDHRIRMTNVLCALGAVLIEQNRYDEAEPHLAKAVELSRQKSSATQDAGITAAHSEALANMSRIHLHKGRRDACLQLRREAVEIARWVLEHTAEKEVGHYALAGRLGLLGWAQREYGQLEEAFTSYLESQEQLRKATGLPQESERRQMVASNQQQIGRILNGMGRRSEAKASLEEAVRGLQRLRAEDAMNVGYQRGLAASLAYLAAIEQDEPSNVGSARQHAAEALRILRAIVKQDPKNEKAKAELREFETLLRSAGSGRAGEL